MNATGQSKEDQSSNTNCAAKAKKRNCTKTYGCVWNSSKERCVRGRGKGKGKGGSKSGHRRLEKGYGNNVENYPDDNKIILSSEINEYDVSRDGWTDYLFDSWPHVDPDENSPTFADSSHLRGRRLFRSTKDATT